MQQATAEVIDLEEVKGGEPPHLAEITAIGIEKNLSGYAVFLFLTLRAAMNRKTRTCRKPLETLSREMRCARSTIQKAVHELKTHGLIRVTNRPRKKGRFSTNEFFIEDKIP